MQFFTDAKLLLQALNASDWNIEGGLAEVIPNGLNKLSCSMKKVDHGILGAPDFV